MTGKCTGTTLHFKKLSKKLVAGFTTMCLVVVGLSGCINQDDGIIGETQNNQAKDTEVVERYAKEYEEIDKMIASVRPEKTVTLTVFSNASDYHGLQGGWFRSIMLDKFNVDLEFIGNEETGFLTGKQKAISNCDIIVWNDDDEDYIQAVENQWLLDWEADNRLQEYGNYIKNNMYDTIRKNKSINDDWKLYAIGSDIALSADEYGEFEAYPELRWDVYNSIGSPGINELEDYVEVLKKMQEACPTSDTGKKVYGMSIHPVNDDTMPQCVIDICAAFFGLEESGMGFYNVNERVPANRFEGILDKDGHYYRTLKFLNTLYREGLLDPDSSSQSSFRCESKYSDGAVLCAINSEGLSGKYNTIVHTAQGRIMLPVIAKNEELLVSGLSTGGDSKLWSIGSKSEYPELCMALINWMCTPRGALTCLYGPKGVGWDYDLEGNACLMQPGYNGVYGGGGDMPIDSGYSGNFNTGSPKFGSTTWSINAKNPESNNQTFNALYWSNVNDKDVSKVEEEWREYTGCNTVKDYLLQHNYKVVKTLGYSYKAKSADLEKDWYRVSKIICVNSWKIMYAQNEKEFNKLFDEMVDSANEAGYVKCERWSIRELSRMVASEE